MIDEASALGDLDELLGVADRYPLAAVRLWDAGPGRTSQRAAFAGTGDPVTCVFGGNKAGKTFILGVWICCQLLGGDHPAVAAFLAANRLAGLIPRGPSRCRLVALDSGSSIEYHRPLVDRLLEGCQPRWWNRDGKGESRLQIAVAGYRDPAVLTFKSDDQGRGKHQGASCRAIGVDEEGSEDVWDESLFRLRSDPVTGETGRIMLAMTPLRGLRWVHRRYVAQPEVGARVHYLHAVDNPHEDRGQIERRLARFDEDVAAARGRGEWVQVRGRVYPSWSRALHVVAAHRIPAGWPRYRGLDFGWRHPTAVVWGAVSPDDQLHVYREHYRSEWSTEQHVAAIQAAERCGCGGSDGCPECGGTGSERITESWADPSRPDVLVEWRRKHGYRFRGGTRDIQLGIDAITERLRSEVAGGQRALVVHDCCVHLIREIEGYVHPEGPGGRDIPLRLDDHALDALRYVALGVSRRDVGVS